MHIEANLRIICWSLRSIGGVDGGERIHGASGEDEERVGEVEEVVVLGGGRGC